MPLCDCITKYFVIVSTLQNIDVISDPVKCTMYVLLNVD